MFNCAVMGYNTSQHWMDLILEQLDNIAAKLHMEKSKAAYGFFVIVWIHAQVMNIANISRVQEECSTLALSLDKFATEVVFGDFRSVAMSSLKACVPDWNEEHEVAWMWLWGHVDRMLSEIRGKPEAQMKRLTKFLDNLSEEDAQRIRKGVHAQFFELAPAGQDYFKQSNTRLYFISQRVIDLSLRLYQDPSETIRQISELGLKHVGLAIPTEFFPPFVTAATHALAQVTDVEAVIEAFRWSIALMGRILARTVVEGQDQS